MKRHTSLSSVLLRLLLLASPLYSQYVQINMCSEELRNGDNVSPKGYTVLPLGECILHTGGNYQRWTENEVLRTPTDHYFTRGLYSDSTCETPTNSGVQDLVLPVSCEVVIIPGNTDPYPNILYSVQLHDTIPAAPGNGRVDFYYDEPGCSTMLGYTYLQLQACQFDANGYIVNYEDLDIPISDFIISTCGELWYYNSADNTCVPTDKVKTPKILDLRLDECDSYIDNPFVFTVSAGINVKSKCKLPGAVDPTCFSGQEYIQLESGERKMIKDIVVGDRVQTMKGPTEAKWSYSRVIAIPHPPNNQVATFIQITTQLGHRVRMTPWHLLPVIVKSPSTGATFTLSKAESVSVGSHVMTVEGVDEVVSNEVIVSQGLYTIVTEDEYIVVSGILVSPFAVSHTIGHMFYSLLQRLGVLDVFTLSSFVTSENAFTTSIPIVSVATLIFDSVNWIFNF